MCTNEGGISSFFFLSSVLLSVGADICWRWVVGGSPREGGSPWRGRSVQQNFWAPGETPQTTFVLLSLTLRGLRLKLVSALIPQIRHAWRGDFWLSDWSLSARMFHHNQHFLFLAAEPLNLWMWSLGLGSCPVNPPNWNGYNHLKKSVLNEGNVGVVGVGTCHSFHV